MEEAKLLLEKNSLKGALNRVYYSMFYAANSLLVLKGLGSSKHSGVISMFDKEFVKDDKVSISASKKLHMAFELRLNGDYDDFAIVERSTVEGLIKDASEFLNEIQKVVKEWT